MKNILIVSSTKIQIMNYQMKLKIFLTIKKIFPLSYFFEEFDLPLYNPGLEQKFIKTNLSQMISRK